MRPKRGEVDEFVEKNLKVEEIKADFTVLDPSIVLYILSYHIFPFNRYTYCIFQSSSSDIVVLNNLFGYFRRDLGHIIHKLYACFKARRLYKHYLALIQFRNSINPFRGAIYVDLMDNEHFSDNLLLYSFASGTERLKYLNLQNSCVTTRGLVQLFTKSGFPSLRYLNIENAGLNCDLFSAIEAGILNDLKRLQVLKYSPPITQDQLESPPKKKKKKSETVVNYSDLIANKCPELQIIKIESKEKLPNFAALFRLTLLVEIELVKPVIGKEHVELIGNLTNLHTLKLMDVQWERGFSDKQLNKWCNRIEYLTLSRCKLKDSDIEPLLHDKSPLISLDLSFNESIFGKCSSKFENCPNLTTISFANIKKVSRKNLEGLLSSKVTDLDLSNCDLKDNKIKGFLSKLPDSLRCLNLSGNDLSDDSLEMIISNHSLCEIDLSRNINLLEVSNLSSLESVTLRNVVSGKANKNEIEAGISELLTSPNLKSLIASGNKIKNINTLAITKTTSLTLLDLSDNELTDHAVQEIFKDVLNRKEKQPLIWLNIASNRITYDGISSLQTINTTLNADTCNLRYIDLSHNPCATDNAIMEHSILDKVASTFYDLIMEYPETQDGYDSAHDSDFEFDLGQVNEDDHHIEEDE